MLQICEETNLILHWEDFHFMMVEELVSSHMLSSKGIDFDKKSSQAHESAKFFKKKTKTWHNDHIPKNTLRIGDIILLINIRLKLI